MNLLENAKKHFNSLGTREIKVPQWDGVIYSTPITAKECSEINSSSKDEVDRIVKTIIIKSLDEDKKPIFKNADFYDLKNKIDFVVLRNVYDQIVDDFKIEDQKKD